MSVSNTAKLYRVRRTILEMLTDRGYPIPNADLKSSMADFTEMYGEHPARTSLDFVVEKKGEKLMVFFCPDASINAQVITAFANRMMCTYLNLLSLSFSLSHFPILMLNTYST